MSWLISKALMNSLYSQGLEVESLEESYSDGEQSVPSNGNPTPLAYCAPDKMKDFSRLFRYGVTFKPLMEDLGEELLTLFRGAFLVRTFQQQGEAQGLTENDQECGKKWLASFVKFDLDSCSWRTHQCSLLGDLELFSETWPQWGLMRDGECWEQRTLEQTIRGTESGLSENKWPTPGASDAIRGTSPNWKPIRPSGQPAQYPLNQALRDSTGLTGRPNPMWVEWLMGWPIQWTDLKPLEMDKSLYVQQSNAMVAKT
jgi:hypothetical protein